MTGSGSERVWSMNGGRKSSQWREDWALAWPGSVYYYYSVFDWENELFDNIEGKFTFATEPVPEPAPMVLFGSGLAGFIGVQLRQTRRRNKIVNR
ncbi:PEP-CTERM sorting domain-containing protein [Desulfosediminicola sp.]|uniref:PEP-CTERM sorting domain-containing protein n=1 Tax=Desulfosediminicola sp. TaxID=2886825 RepID=UPI003AF2F202